MGKSNQTKGWLENYNDSTTTAPQGYVGDGYSNVGRNYSPAWGGQFQNGGKTPLYVESKNDPRYKAYQDSLALHNEWNQNRVNNLLKQGWKYDTKDNVKKNIKFSNKDKKEFQSYTKVNPKKGLQKIVETGNDGKQDNDKGGYADTKASSNLYHGKIAPIELAPLFDDYWRTSKTKFKTDSKGNFIHDSKGHLIDEKNPNYGKPFANDTHGKVIRNFFNVPIYKKPNLEVRVGEPSQEDLSINIQEPVIVKPKEVKPKEKLVPLQPISKGLENTDTQIGNPDISIPIHTRVPQSYDVTSQRQTMNGPSDYYNYDKQGVSLEQAVKAKQAADAYNQYVLEKYGNSKNPKAQERLKQLTQDVQVTPNYQIGGSVYPVNYVPQAQNGTMNKDTSTPLIPYSNEYIDGLKNDYLKLYNNPDTRMDDGYDAFYHSMIDNLPDVTRKAKGWIEYKPGTEIQEFTEDDGNNSAPTPSKNRMVKRVEDYEISDRPNTLEQDKLAKYIQQEMYPFLDRNTVSNKGFQTGGSFPGATGHMYARYEQGGDIDFSYPRTQGIPSNGPYAKKTMASAQEGVRLDMYGAPITAIEVTDPNLDRSHYDPRLNIVSIGNDYNIWHNNKGEQITGKELEEHRNKLKTHEHYHAKQHKEGRDNYDIAHHTNNEQWAQMQKRPQMMATDSEWNKFYNRGDIENTQDYTNYINAVPEARILNPKFLFDKVLDSSRYANPFNQEGEAMYYEQMGKEFSPYEFNVPKNKNGGHLNKYDVAQDGDFLDKFRESHPSVRSLINDTTNRKIQSKGKGKEVKTVQKDNTKTVTPKIGKIATAKEKEQRAIEQNKLAQQQSEEQAAKDWVQNSMQEAYKSPLMSPGYFTPEGAAIGALQGATKLGPDLYEGNYKGAAMDALMALPIAIPASKVAGQLTKQGLREGVDLFHPVGKALRQIEQEGIASGLSAQEIKKLQLEKVGITSLQREGYFPGVSEIVTEYITPYSYENAGKRIKDIPRRIIQGERNSKNLSDIDVNFPFDYEAKNLVSKPRYDAWRMYSGLPQKNNTFRIAETAPIDHPSYINGELDNLEKFSLNDENKLLKSLPNETDLAYLHYGDPEDLVNALPDLKSRLQNIQDIKNKGMDVGNDFMHTNLMGGYNRRYLDNIMEYNDIWDLDLKGTKVEKYFGKPFLSHGQLDYSFDPAIDELNKVIERGEIYNRNIPKYVKPKPKYIDNIDNYTNKFLKNLKPKDVIVNKKQKQGGIIDSDRGQWDHPGKITRIKSGNITMKPDPKTGKALTQPILGIADTGEQQWMYPGEDYNFEGANYVTEYPKGKKPKMAKNGLRQEQKGLVNLNQLTNFTNYNTKQPGGWLDNY